MRISLDYYRILTVPIKASQEQIDRAYEDRIQQKPRREYSQIAVNARKSLLQQAYDILSDETERAEYDDKFLTRSNSDKDQSSQDGEASESESYPVYPTIEIPPKLLVGALIILHELAEYEQVIRLADYYFNNLAYIDEFEQGRSNWEYASEAINSSSDPRDDIVLAITLSYLELGREQWRIQKYENAAKSVQMGLNLLAQEPGFYKVKEELETDLYKLRPYRILDLLANSSADSPQREMGLNLLKEMLQQRQGIEGKGEDYSGLKFDKFLGFIQQVRNYLTTTEQIELFVAEAQRPSFVATYLAMYALLAEGYGTKQPKLVVKAQEMLQSLSDGQEEVHWEQSICALLLGQAKQAHKAIEQSQENATVELIRQYSQGSPDLLPGLCFYGEKWLLQEVLSQFRDLAHCQVSIKDYFADKNVQSYLETISPANTKLQNTQVRAKETVSNSLKASSTVRMGNTLDSKKTTLGNWFPWNKTARTSVAQSAYVPMTTTPEIKPKPQVKSHGNTATLEKKQVTVTQGEIKQPSHPPSSFNNNSKKKPLRKKRAAGHHKKASSSLIMGSLLSLGLILGIGALGFAFTKNILQSSSKPVQNIASKPEKPTPEIEEPPVNVSPEKPKNIAQEAPKKPAIIDNAIAKKVVATWLSSKSAALGNQHNIDQLNKILAPSQVSKWRNIALQDKRNNIYRQYQHSVTISSVKFSEDQPNQATIEAQVKEKTQYYQQGRSNSFKSSEDNLLVRYQLIRQGESWLINKSEVVKSL
ncbi:MAG: IMS domain-containing protein [Xenococcaceae cyanobacterium MO_167.B27]|nr:IMS domain-containing protein [Xenococcaceae cyanobacterium MO_167.B27]